MDPGREVNASRRHVKNDRRVEQRDPRNGERILPEAAKDKHLKKQHERDRFNRIQEMAPFLSVLKISGEHVDQRESREDPRQGFEILWVFHKPARE